MAGRAAVVHLSLEHVDHYHHVENVDNAVGDAGMHVRNFGADRTGKFLHPVDHQRDINDVDDPVVVQITP